MAVLDYSLLGEVDRLTEGNKLRKPTSTRDRWGRWHRDPAGELDWFYQLPPLERAYVQREYMAPSGVPVDVLATMAGMDVDAFGDALIAAIRAARARTDRRRDPLEWEQEDDDDDELLGPDEVAELLGVKRNTLAQWRHRGKLPDPYVTLSGLPIWRRGDVMAFAVNTGREVIDPA